MIARLGERGAAAAEFAVVLPAAALVLLLGAGALSAGVVAVRLQDASADAARLVARGESEGRAIGAVSAAVDGASASIEHRGDLVCVAARAPAAVVVSVSASSCALAGGR